MAVAALSQKDKMWGDTSNSLMRLHESFPAKSESYSFSDITIGDGPVHNRNYSCSLQVVTEGQVFPGQGRSKQMAKRDAAELALHTLFHEEKMPSPYMNRMRRVLGEPVLPVPAHREQGTLAPGLVEGIGEKRQHDQVKIKPPPAVLNTPKRHKPVLPTKSNPLYAFNLKHPEGATWELIEQTGPAHARVFRNRLLVEGCEFIGEGASKKQAKADAARQALQSLDGVQLPEIQPVLPVDATELIRQVRAGTATSNPGPPIADPPHSHSTVLAERLQRCCVQKFAELRASLPDAQQQFKVLAGIVQLRGGAVATEASATVVALATGTKCVHGDELAVDGTAVNDCHAEVLARRAFCMYAHDQIRRTATGQESVFERVSVGSRDVFALNPVVSFHLFVSSAPCGDGRIFTVSGDAGGGGAAGAAARGKLRHKIEGGEGGALCDGASSVQTLDGMAAGERLRTMTCSDKVLRWNALGMQGSLLARILFSPIYCETMTIGDIYQYEHLNRAAFGRLAGISLPEPFCLQRPFIAKSTPVPEDFIAAHSSSAAVNWFLSAGRPELINTSTGRQLDGSPSRLCKRSQAAVFIKTSGLLGVATGSQLPAMTYAQLKAQSRSYQGCKAIFFDALRCNGLGCWTHKPVEQDQFLV